jgi:hypothetical protein
MLVGMMPSLSPFYPDVRVSVRSRNRFALVSAIRYGLRRAGKPHDEIERFSQEALSVQDPRRLEEICQQWVLLEQPKGR